MARKSTISRSRTARAEGPLRLAIEGIGDVFEKKYLPALRKLAETRGRLDLTIVDKSEFWKPAPELARKIQGNIEAARRLGSVYIDKSNPDDLAGYEKATPDIVIVATPDATHVDVALSWLERDSPPGRIFIEKPLADSLNASRRLLGRVGPMNGSVLAYDHYRARLLPTRTQLGTLLGFWAKGLKSFTFYFLEDHSGADSRYRDALKVGRDGAIENEQREQTLDRGLILDLMPHVIAVLAHFVRVETLVVSRVRAGQYTGVDGDPDRRAGIKGETFADIGVVCRDLNGGNVKGTVYLGKGVRGVRALGAEYDGDVKLLDIVGLNGNRTRFDMRSAGAGSSKAHLIDRDGIPQLEFPLNSDPYHVFLSRLWDGSFMDEPRIALSVEVGKATLGIIEDIRFAVPKKDGLAVYPSGMQSGRESPYLEEVLSRLPVIYGVGS